MKKAMLHTKVSVKLRKSELRDEWYLYLEAYPVFKLGHDKPCREREYLNRIITTPMWDKTRPARIDKDGVQTYKPKRDIHRHLFFCKRRRLVLIADIVCKVIIWMKVQFTFIYKMIEERLNVFYRFNM